MAGPYCQCPTAFTYVLDCRQCAVCVQLSFWLDADNDSGIATRGHCVHDCRPVNNNKKRSFDNSLGLLLHKSYKAPSVDYSGLLHSALHAGEDSDLLRATSRSKSGSPATKQ